MKFKRFLGSMILVIMLLFSLISSWSENGDSLEMKNSSSIRIAYLESKPFYNYTHSLIGLTKGFVKEGLLGDVDETLLDYTVDGDAKALWEVLVGTEGTVEFLSDGFFRLSDIDDSETDAFIEALNQREDIDMIMVMGTTAGKFAKANIKDIPMTVFSTSNAYAAGIVDSYELSGVDNLWAHTDQKRYRRQLDAFYDTFQFKSLGMVYEDSETGKAYSAVEMVEAFAEEKGIELVVHGLEPPTSTEDKERYLNELLECYEVISEQVDAFYLTNVTVTVPDVYGSLEPFYDKNIPVFAMLGRSRVKKGALMTVYRFNHDEIGEKGVDVIMRIVEGESPGEINQSIPESPSLAVNLKAAEDIEWEIPFELLLSSDYIYEDKE